MTANEPRDDIIYTTLKHPAPLDGQSRQMEMETASLSSAEIMALSNDQEFLDSPVAVLRRNGMKNDEIMKLMQHPNFLNDPLAALKMSKAKTNGESSLSSRKDILQNSSALSVVNELDEPPLFH